jgi:hypothetical protein
MTPPPPQGLPRYRVLTGPDDAAFCHRVSEAIDLGYRLHGGPAVTFDGERVIVAQALLWPDRDDRHGAARADVERQRLGPPDGSEVVRAQGKIQYGVPLQLVADRIPARWLGGRPKRKRSRMSVRIARSVAKPECPSMSVFASRLASTVSI